MQRGPELLRLSVLGQAAGAGSKTPVPKGRWAKGQKGSRFIPFTDARGVPMVGLRHASKFTGPWMEKVEAEARAAWGSREPLSGALWLDVYCYQTRNADHFFHRKSGRVLRPDAPAYPDVTETHDSDKMRRAISDSLTKAQVIADDKRLIGGEVWKNYAENIGEDRAFAVVILGRMAEQTVEDLGLASPDPEGQAALPVS